MNDQLLHLQLRNHWIGAASGLTLFRRVAKGHGMPQIGAEVDRLAGEIQQDREALRAIMRDVGASRPMVTPWLARAAVHLGRLKPNGRVVRRSPLSDVVELEALRIAIAGKLAGWELLRELTDVDPRLDPDLLDDLIMRALEQQDELQRLYLRAARRHLGGQ